MAFSARRALVVGNADYTERPLRNPVSDAELMSGALSELGFEVTMVLNADRNRFNREINNFAQLIREEDEVVFFYSGHGVQINGSNYLLPVKEYFSDETDIEHKAASLNWINEKLSRAKITLVFLDACRDNPYVFYRGGAQGLATMGSGRNETFIMYSTEAGAVANDGVGQNSTFSRSLAENILVPGLSIDEISYRVSSDVSGASNGSQRPWRTNNISAPYYFSKGDSPSLQMQTAPLYVDNARGGSSIYEKPRGKDRLDDGVIRSEHVFRNLRFLTSTEFNSRSNNSWDTDHLISRNQISLKIPWFGVEAEYNYLSGPWMSNGSTFEDHKASQFSIGAGMPDPEELRLFVKVAQNERPFLYTNWMEHFYKLKYHSYSGEFARRMRTEHQLSELYIRFEHNALPNDYIPLPIMDGRGNIKSRIPLSLAENRLEIGAFLSNITDFYNEPVEFQGISPDTRPLFLLEKAGALLSVKFIMQSMDTDHLNNWDMYDVQSNYPKTLTGAEFCLPIKFSRYFGVNFGYDHYQAEHEGAESFKSSHNYVSGGLSLSLMDFRFIKLVANADYTNFSTEIDDQKIETSYFRWSPVLMIRPWKGMGIFAHYQAGGYGRDIGDALNSLSDESILGFGFSLRL
jgi:hypothetical protein